MDIFSREADVDIFSREADVLRPSLTARDGEAFLRSALPRRFGGFVQTIQTDGGSEFETDGGSEFETDGGSEFETDGGSEFETDGGSEFEAEFARSVGLYCRRHRVARPYKKNEQSHIESFNRTVRKECLGWGKFGPEELAELTGEVEDFLDRYHFHRPHLAFEPMRPPLKRAGG